MQRHGQRIKFRLFKLTNVLQLRAANRDATTFRSLSRHTIAPCAGRMRRDRRGARVTCTIRKLVLSMDHPLR